jgi:protease IV
MANDRQESRWRAAGRKTLTVIGGITVFFILFLLVTSLLLRREGVPSRVILELDLERGVVEYVPDDPFATLLRRDAITTRDVVEALKRAESDDRVLGLVARTAGGGLGMAQVEEIRDAVTSFRATGKPALFFSETFGEFGPGRSGYYLATAFDEIHLQPSGDVGLTGLVAEIPFLRGTLDEIGILPQVDQRHEYKDALLLFSDESLTAPAREAIERILTSMYENLVEGIATGRGLDPQRVRELIDGGPYFGEEAVRAGLVDRLSYRDEVYDSLRETVGGSGEFLFAHHYLNRAGRPHQRGPAIALIYGTGTVMRGTSQIDPFVGGASLGSETVTRAIRDAVAADDVRAIIFRIDSPGGSYVASDAVWREVQRARAAGKPVIATMGNMAGSGGYFVAMGADRIVAQPSTLTGSIGVAGGKMVVTELTERLGVTWDDVQVGGNATMWSPFSEFTEPEWDRFQTSLDRIYADFTAKAAAGRNLSVDSLHTLARGRVWTGADAQRIGLVDELGGFDVALRLARDIAGLDPDEPVRLRVYPRERTLFEMLVDARRPSSYDTRAIEAALRGAAVAGQLLEGARLDALLSPAGPLVMPFVGWP